MIEAVDSSFWPLWPDDDRLKGRISGRFADVTSIRPPTEFHPDG
jgi:hypothetical protein